MSWINLRCVAAVAALAILAGLGCDRDSKGLEPATASTDPIVFDDNYGPGATYQAFLDSKFDAVQLDSDERYQGTASLKITVPPPSNEPPFFAGGAFTTNQARDLSGYNALTFWAKTSMTATLNVAGLGNDNTGTSRYIASWSGIPLTTTWSKVVIPIPRPEKLSLEQGLFFFAEGHENEMGYDLWFDEIMFETIGTITNPRPVLPTRTIESFVGATVNVGDTEVTFDVDGTDQTITHSPGYLTFTSSDGTVVDIVDEEIRVVGPGNATLTAKLGTIDASGEVTVSVTDAPTTPAPTPTFSAQDVISLFSNAYQNVTVDTWSATWDGADLTDFSIGEDDVKAYTNLVFAGIEFASETIDATAMTHFHMDIWIPEGTQFWVKLVDFGEDGVFDGTDNSEHDLPFTTNSDPPLVTGTWVSLDIPLDDFLDDTPDDDEIDGLQSAAHLAQLLIRGNMRTVYVDNIYFHR